MSEKNEVITMTELPEAEIHEKIINLYLRAQKFLLIVIIDGKPEIATGGDTGEMITSHDLADAMDACMIRDDKLGIPNPMKMFLRKKLLQMAEVAAKPRP